MGEELVRERECWGAVGEERGQGKSGLRGEAGKEWRFVARHGVGMLWGKERGTLWGKERGTQRDGVCWGAEGEERGYAEGCSVIGEVLGSYQDRGR